MHFRRVEHYADTRLTAASLPVWTSRSCQDRPRASARFARAERKR